MKIDNLKLEDCVTAQKATILFRKCDKCDHNMLDGTAKCPSCYVSMEAWMKHGVTIVLQQKSAGWKAVPLRSMASLPSVRLARCSQESTGPALRHAKGIGQGGPTSGSMKDGAKKEVKKKKLKKTGFATIKERMENDPFFMYNCSIAQLTPPCCDFLHRLGACISPDVGRTFEARREGKGTDVKTEEADARKGRQVAKHCVFPMICGSGGSKSRLAKVAGAEPAAHRGDEKLAGRTFRSQNVYKTL